MKHERKFYLITIFVLILVSSALLVSALTANAALQKLNKYDVNEDDVVDISDVSYLLNYLANPNAVQEPVYDDPTFVVDSASAEAGESNVMIPIRVVKNPGVSSIALQVTYGNGLTLTAVNFNTDVFRGATVTSQTLNSPAFVSWVGGTTDVEEDAVFVTLVFDVAPDAEGTIAVSVSYDEDDVYDINEDNVFFETVSGGVTVTR